MKLLILGDLHLGRSQSIGKNAELDKLNSRLQDQCDLLDWAYDLCAKDDQLNDIFITGDVFQDFRPYPTVIIIFLKWLKKCEKANINVHIILGNHDIIRSGQHITAAIDIATALELSNVKIYKEFDCVNLDGFSIVIAPFRDKRMYDIDSKDDALAKFKQDLDGAFCKAIKTNTKICLGHFALEGSLAVGDEISDYLNELYIPIDMFNDFDYVWMGHIHHPQVLNVDEPYAAHIGSLDRSDFSKTEISSNKIAIILDSLNDNDFQEVVIPTRNLIPISIKIPLDKDPTDFIINDLCILSKEKLLKDSIIKLDISLSAETLEDIDKDKVKSYLYDNLEIHNLCSFTETRSLSEINFSEDDCILHDVTLDTKTTIKKWAEKTDLQFDNDKERMMFFAFTEEVIDEYEEKVKK